MASAISGGSAKPNSSSTPVPNAVAAGRKPGDGSSAGATDVSSATSRLWPAQRQCDAGDARDDAERRELQHEQRERLAPRRAEAAEHGRGVEMAPQVTRCREGHRDGREDHRDQCGEAQELFRPLERLPHLGPQIADVLHPLAGLQLGRSHAR